MFRIPLIILLNTLILACMPSTTAFGQTDKDELKTTFEAYFKTVELKENEKTLEYIYPKLFEHFPKEKMLQSMNNAKSDTSTVITVKNASVTNISESIELNNIKYAVLQYSFIMTMKFMPSPPIDEESETDDKHENPAEFTYEIMKEKYGESNVSLNAKKNILTVNVSNEMYGINEPAYSGWKFLDKKESMKPILEKLIPKKVLKEL